MNHIIFDLDNPKDLSRIKELIDEKERESRDDLFQMFSDDLVDLLHTAKLYQLSDLLNYKCKKLHEINKLGQSLFNEFFCSLLKYSVIYPDIAQINSADYRLYFSKGLVFWLNKNNIKNFQEFSEIDCKTIRQLPSFGETRRTEIICFLFFKLKLILKKDKSYKCQ